MKIYLVIISLYHLLSVFVASTSVEQQQQDEASRAFQPRLSNGVQYETGTSAGVGQDDDDDGKYRFSARILASAKRKCKKKCIGGGGGGGGSMGMKSGSMKMGMKGMKAASMNMKGMKGAKKPAGSGSKSKGKGGGKGGSKSRSKSKGKGGGKGKGKGGKGKGGSKSNGKGGSKSKGRRTSLVAVFLNESTALPTSGYDDVSGDVEPLGSAPLLVPEAASRLEQESKGQHCVEVCIIDHGCKQKCKRFSKQDLDLCVEVCKKKNQKPTKKPIEQPAAAAGPIEEPEKLISEITVNFSANKDGNEYSGNVLDGVQNGAGLVTGTTPVTYPAFGTLIMHLGTEKYVLYEIVKAIFQ